MKIKIPIFAASAALGALLCPLSANADYLSATLNQPLTEVSHIVEVKIVNGVATMTVQRTFANSGTIEEEASLDIDLPVEAVATGLRIKSGDTWYAGDLMDSEKAAKLYLELTGLGLFEPKDPAILFWDRLGVLHLQVFPIFPGKSSTVEYTLTVPTEYIGGQYYVSYPKKTDAANLAEPSFRFVSEDKTIKAFVDSQELALGTNSKVTPTRIASIPKARTSEAAVEITDSVTRVSSKLKVNKKGTIAKASASIDIKHTYRGDLVVKLKSPSGKEQILFNQKDGDANDLVATYPLDELINEEANGEWTLIIEDHAAVDVGTLKSWKLALELQNGEKKSFTAKDTPLFLPDIARSDWDGDSGGGWLAAGYTKLSMTAPKIDVVSGRMGKVSIEGEKSDKLYRIELDTAAQLSALPKKLSVIFLVDASYSVEEGGTEPQLQVIKSFLSHVPDASAEVIVYRRFAERVFGTFTEASQFERAIAKAKKAGTFSLGNGSALENGLQLAAQILKDRKSTGPTMVVALTDTMLRSRFTNQLALDAMLDLPKDTVVHIVHRQEDADELKDYREDSAPLAPISAAHKGVYLRIAGESPSNEIDAVSLGLVRPIRIDQCSVSFSEKAGAPLATPADFWEVPATFYEGEGLRVMSIKSATPESMVVTGKLWQEEVRREVKVTKEFSKITAAFAFSGDLYSSLSDAQQRALAFYGGAVSPVTSYLAIEPGVRPSRAGIDRMEAGGGFGLGLRGTGVGGGGYGGIGMVWVKDIAALAKTDTDACLAKYPKAQGWSAKIEVESNYQEVIDVVSNKSDALGACIVDAIWSVQLNPAFKSKTETFNLSY